MSKPITSDSFNDPFRFLDAKRAEYDTQRKRAFEVLKECGWVLRPNHPITMVWRARRWTKSMGTERLSSPTCDGLIALVRAEAAPRIAARKEREAAAEKKRAEKGEKAA